LTIQADATSADGTTNPPTDDQAITEKPSTSEAGFTKQALSWMIFSYFETYWLKNPQIPKIVILRNRDITYFHNLLVQIQYKCTIEEDRAANQRSAFSLSLTLALYINNGF